jgi:retron-type reverse transcriptase
VCRRGLAMSRIIFNHAYNDIISVENLLDAWKEFIKGKRKRKDVQEFKRNLMPNILELHQELVTHTYHHAPYQAFNISDPKPRRIHKAKVRDRLLHHALYRKLYPFFDRTFIADSFSCRLEKGTHRAVGRFRIFFNRSSQNHTKTVWILKCDIRKFFASVDHTILIHILEKYIADANILELLYHIISSFSSADHNVGLPLGNLTSQLFVNIYMNQFDQFVKHRLKVRYYIRYADDFVIFFDSRDRLETLLCEILEFLWRKLHLSLHPDKISITTITSGVDFLGWVNFPHHKVIRTVTKRRMIKKLQWKKGDNATLQSYLGLLKHGDSYKLSEHIKKNF